MLQTYIMNDFDIIPKPTSHKKKKKKVKQEKEDLEYLLKVEFFLLERKMLKLLVVYQV